MKSVRTKIQPVFDKSEKSLRARHRVGPHRTRNVVSKMALPKKRNKSIEIITVPSSKTPNKHQKNVGIIVDEKRIFALLSQRYQDVRISEITTETDLQSVLQRRPDLVFSGVRYFNFGGTDIWLSDCLDQSGIAYITSSRQALEREAQKSRAKDIVQKAGLQTAQYFTAVPGQYATAASIPIAFPLFLKPVVGGDSRGVDELSYVHDFQGFTAKVAAINSKQNKATLAEAYLAGREFTVGVFKDCITNKYTAMPIEVVAVQNQNGHRILDFDIKRNDEEQVLAVSHPLLRKQLSTMAQGAFAALGGKSFGRIDIKMDHNGVLHFIEANLMPGLGEGYFYQSCLLNLNMSYTQMIHRIAANGLGYSFTETGF